MLRRLKDVVTCVFAAGHGSLGTLIASRRRSQGEAKRVLNQEPISGPDAPTEAPAARESVGSLTCSSLHGTDHGHSMGSPLTSFL